MHPSLPSALLANLAMAAACPRADHHAYLADCVVRFLQAHPARAPHGPWTIRAGIGTLSRDTLDGPLVFTSAAIPAAPPPLSERAALFAKAIARWTSQGLPVADASELSRRRAACESCVHRAPPALANGWLGSCRLCGCTGAKLHLATEHCPDTTPRW